jgi:hypothetical protein
VLGRDRTLWRTQSPPACPSHEVHRCSSAPVPAGSIHRGQYTTAQAIDIVRNLGVKPLPDAMLITLARRQHSHNVSKIARSIAIAGQHIRLRWLSVAPQSAELCLSVARAGSCPSARALSCAFHFTGSRPPIMPRQNPERTAKHRSRHPCMSPRLSCPFVPFVVVAPSVGQARPPNRPRKHSWAPR